MCLSLSAGTRRRARRTAHRLLSSAAIATFTTDEDEDEEEAEAEEEEEEEEEEEGDVDAGPVFSLSFPFPLDRDAPIARLTFAAKNCVSFWAPPSPPSSSPQSTCAACAFIKRLAGAQSKLATWQHRAS